MSMASRWRHHPSAAATAAVVVLLIATLTLALIACSATPASASAKLVQLSTDTLVDGGVDTSTEVEPDSYSYGSTIVATFQVGRSPSAGAAAIGWATSADNGHTWSHGLLPNLTNDVGGFYVRAGDSSVAYDAIHASWLITAVATHVNGVVSGGQTDITTDIIVSRSTNGGFAWSNPIVVAHGDVLIHPYDKPWIVCDTTPSSPYHGRCYDTWAEYESGSDPDSPSSVAVSASTDGGLTWNGTPIVTETTGGSAQPLVQPNGTVIVPFTDASDIPGDTFGKSILAIRSTDGGATWSAPVTVAPLNIHVVAGQMRALPLPSAEMDAAGKVFVTWQDCHYEPLCATNDLVLSTSTDGVQWSAPQRIPIHAVGSGYDEFIPGLAVDRATSGNQAHLGLAYYFFVPGACCKLYTGWVQSSNGGQSWTNEYVLAGPMQLAWLPNTLDGYMVGDYISSSFSQKHKGFPIFAVAKAPNGPQCDPATTCDEAIYTVKNGI